MHRLRVATNSVAMADEKGSALWPPWGTLNRGCVLVLSGKASEAEQVIRTAIVAFRSTGATVWTPCYLTFLARALSAIGHFEEALAFARDARAITSTSGELWFVSDIHRTIGEIALLGSEPNLTEAQSQFVRALEIARERQARSFETLRGRNSSKLKQGSPYSWVQAVGSTRDPTSPSQPDSRRYLARDNDDRLKSLTLFAAQTDFTEPGGLGLFIDDSQLALLEDVMFEQGVLEASQMAGTFHLMRSNDLVWSRVINHYLMGEPDKADALTAWSSDATRMPYKMHSEYLRTLFLNNDLAEGRRAVTYM